MHKFEFLRGINGFVRIVNNNVKIEEKRDTFLKGTFQLVW